MNRFNFIVYGSNFASFRNLARSKVFVKKSNRLGCIFFIQPNNLNKVKQYSSFHTNLFIENNNQDSPKNQEKDFIFSEDQVNPLLLEARKFYYDKQFDNAISLCNKLINQITSNDNSDKYYAFGIRGLCHYKKEQFEKALNDLNKYLEVNTIDFETKLFRANCNYQLYRFDEMLKDLNEIIFVTSPSGDPSRFVSSRLLRASYYLLSDLNQAFSDLHAIENNLHQPSIVLIEDQLKLFYEGLSLCYASRGEHAKAIHYLNSYIDYLTSKEEIVDANIHLKRAISLMELGQFDKALNDINLFIEQKGIYNEMIGIMSIKAKCLFELKQYKEAKECAEEFLDNHTKFSHFTAEDMIEQAKRTREESMKFLSSTK
ncbi:hypothetical protein ABK040_004716 [Willaertia magna]